VPTCSYCGTELHATGISVVCSFCKARYSDIKNASIDFQRSTKHSIKGYVTSEDVERPVEELEEYHTLDLLLSLRFARAERSQAYYLVRLYNKALDEMPEDAENINIVAEQAIEMYTNWTRRAWIIENILTDRMGYFPERISDEMLEKVKVNSEKAFSKPMKISKERKSNRPK
jgi:hypothetical protein